MYIPSVSLPLNEPYQTIVSLRVGMITLHFLCGGMPDMPHIFGVKLRTGFEAFGPPVKYFALRVSVVILDGASVVQILKVVGVSTVQ